MNSNKQAAKGFKTFILTLVISLAVFSGIYYFINSQEKETISKSAQGSRQELAVPASRQGNVEEATLGDNSGRVASEEELVTPEETAPVTESVGLGEAPAPSVFAQLASQKMDVPQRMVLAGSDTASTTAAITTGGTAPSSETAQSTVPDTGMSGPTLGVVLTLVILGFAAYIMFLGPRNIALYNFEKDVLDDLD